MRIAVLILGLVLGAVMVVQTFLVYALSGIANNRASGQSGAVGLFMGLLWLLGSALAIPIPLASVVFFALAGVLGFGAAAAFPDLAVWGGASLVLAVLSFFGWRGKRRQDAQARVDREEQRLLRERVATLDARIDGR